MGMAMMAASSVLFAAMACLLRAATDVDCYTAALFRFVVGMALLTTAAMSGWVRLEFRRRKLLFLRGLLGGIGVVLFYYSIQRIGLARGTVIAYTYPVFAALIGMVVLKERLSWAQAGLMLVAFAGIALVVSDEGLGGGGFGLGEGLALLGAVVAGLVVVLIKILRETESTGAIFCAQCAVGLWIVLLPASGGTGVDGSDAGLMILAGLLAAGGQLLMTGAYRHIPVSTGSMLSMLAPVLSTLLAARCFQESLSGTNLMGMALVTGACALILVRPVRTRTRDGSEKLSQLRQDAPMALHAIVDSGNRSVPRTGGIVQPLSLKTKSPPPQPERPL